MTKLLTSIFATLLVFALASALVTVQDAPAAVTRAEILEPIKTELKKVYNDPSLNPAATALCKVIASRVNPLVPDTSQLDYDLDTKQSQYFAKAAIQLDMEMKTRGLVVWRIFRDACKAEVGFYQRPHRLNRWRSDSWYKVATQQEVAFETKCRADIKRLKERKLSERRQCRSRKSGFHECVSAAIKRMYDAIPQGCHKYR